MPHTPGPWIVLKHQIISENAYKQIGAYYTIAEINQKTAYQETVEANEKLIAAAPDLLEACKALILRLDRACSEGRANPTFLESERLVLRNAIAKAEGKP